MNPSSAINESINSGAYIIGTSLNDYAVLDELMTTIPPQMFSNSHHAELWQVMCDLRLQGQPLDMASLTINAPSLVKNIGINQLTKIQSYHLSPTELQWHVKKLTEIFIRRELANGARQLAERAQDISGTSIDELMVGYEQIALTIMQTASGNGLHDGDVHAEQWLNRIEEKMKDPNKAFGFITGWKELDNLTLGWQRQDLIVVGGRTSVGKTAFAIENIVRMLMAGKKVAVFSLEMSEHDMKDRIAANVAGVSFRKLRIGRISNEEWADVKKTKPLISKLAITDERGLTTEGIMAQMKRWKRTKGLDFAVVDYLQEIQERSQTNDNVGSALSRVARKLRKAAQDCDCAVMALSQLSRNAEGKRPTLADISGSSGIESAADVTILLHRDREEEPDLMYVNVAKQRNGETGEIRLIYDRTLQRIRGLND